MILNISKALADRLRKLASDYRPLPDAFLKVESGFGNFDDVWDHGREFGEAELAHDIVKEAEAAEE